MKTLTKKQFDEILNNPENVIISNKSTYKKDDNGLKYHQTIVKYKTPKGKSGTAVREVDSKGAEYYEI